MAKEYNLADEIQRSFDAITPVNNNQEEVIRTKVGALDSTYR